MVFKKKVRVKKFKELDFKSQLEIFKEVKGLGRNAYFFFLNKKTDLIDKKDINNSKIFSSEVTFKESYNYFKETLDNVGLDDRVMEIWGLKVFFNGFPLSNLQKESITPQMLEEIIIVLANQYASVWQEIYKSYEDYDYVLYENIITKPLESLDDYIYLKENEKEHRQNKVS